MTGDWVLTIGLIYRVYAVTGSTVASALTMASSFAPQVLLGAVAGVFADRWDRKRTMIAADLLLAVGPGGRWSRPTKASGRSLAKR
jgi:MFS family permease